MPPKAARAAARKPTAAQLAKLRERLKQPGASTGEGQHTEEDDQSHQNGPSGPQGTSYGEVGLVDDTDADAPAEGARPAEVPMNDGDDVPERLACTSEGHSVVSTLQSHCILQLSGAGLAAQAASRFRHIRQGCAVAGRDARACFCPGASLPGRIRVHLFGGNDRATAHGL